MAKKKPDKLDELLDQMTENATAAEILKDGGLLKELQKRFIERALEGVCQLNCVNSRSWSRPAPFPRTQSRSNSGRQPSLLSGGSISWMPG